MKKFLSLILLAFIVSCTSSHNNLKLPVKEIHLKNGLTALLVSRPGAPVFSAYIRIKVGNIEESKGASGLAHFFEHMAFKGTTTIGTSNYAAEEPVLKEMFSVGADLVEAKKEGRSDVSALEEKLHALEVQHQQLINQNEFVRIYQRNGGGDINATTSNDFTSYFVSLPASKLELWAYMESERLKHPVLREFFKERDVVAEERRMRYDNNPDGKLYEAFLDTAFDSSPYKINVIGYPQEIQQYTYDKAMEFRNRYYIPQRIVIGLAGSFDVKEAEQYIEKYFGDLPAAASDTILENKPQILDNSFPRTKVLEGPDTARFYMGFHRPAHPHSDDEKFDMMQGILCDGRTSRLFKVLVTEKKMASGIDCYSSLPASRLDGLFTIYASPLPGFTNNDIQKVVLDEMEKIKQEGVKPEELARVKNKMDSDMIWSLKSNMGLATLVTFYQSLSNDWKYLYKMQEKIHAITSNDLKSVAQTYFVPGRMVTVKMEQKK
ncbi:insulinase family protein [bacterium]|nr:insulinase family protein [bacterium]